MEARTHLIVASLIELAGCAAAPRVDTVKMGDNDLTCEQLYAEVQKMDAVRADAKADTDKATLATTGAVAAIALAPLTLGLSVIAAPVILGASAIGTSSAINGAAGEAQAGARHQYLVRLFNEKGCKRPQ